MAENDLDDADGLKRIKLLNYLGIGKKEQISSPISEETDDAADGGGDENATSSLNWSFTKAELSDINLSYPTGTKQGLCIIFNQKVFHPKTGQNERHGTDKDRDNLKKLFEETLGFTVRVHNNLNVNQILQILWEEKSNKDLANMTCFVVVMLSHGYDNQIFGADGEFPVDWLILPFKGELCQPLLGKPKLFFLQACRGDKFDFGRKTGVLQSESGGSVQVRKLPVESDILIGYSTVPGFFSWRNNQDGSWFIRKLCEVFSAQYKDHDVMSMLTMVNRLVSVEFASCTDQKWTNDMKQIPSIVSQLTRKLFLK